jgi:hypothetical protein
MMIEGKFSAETLKKPYIYNQKYGYMPKSCHLNACILLPSTVFSRKATAETENFKWSAGNSG